MRKATATVTKEITPQEAEKLMGEYAKAAATHKKLTAQIEEKVTDIRTKYEDKLNAENEIMNEIVPQLEHYAKGVDMNGKKSLDMLHGTIGFRTDTPSLKALKGNKWDDILTKVKKYLPDFVRTKEEIDKKDILANRTEPAVVKNLEKCGMEIVQEEKFFVDTKEEAA